MEKAELQQNYASVNSNVPLSNYANDALTKAANRSGRTKRKEAALRLQDHLQKYPDLAAAGILLIDFHDCASTNVNIQLTEFMNEALTKSAEQTGRTKRIEAALRVQDHLQKYPDIASVGKRFTE